MSKLIAFLAALSTAAACAPAPQYLTADTHFIAPDDETEEIIADAIAQLEYVVPYVVTVSQTGSSVPDVWRVHRTPCGTYIDDSGKALCDGYTGAGNKGNMAIWAADALDADGLRLVLTHEVGHVFGLAPNNEHWDRGVMASPNDTWVFSDAEVDAVRALY